MKLSKFIEKASNKVKTRVNTITEEQKYRKIASKYDFNGYKRIYLVHIRKTGGTSLNNMFLALSQENSQSLYLQLAKTPGNRLVNKGLIYVGWNISHINKGNYFYGFSHTPLYELDLPKDTFTISCFRDPVKRVISHYNMLKHFREKNIDHPCMETEGKWLGESFDDFLERIPRQHLLNQIYMFSDSYDIDEALENVKRLSLYFFSDMFSEGIDKLNKKTGLNLKSIHIRKASYHAQISDDSLTRLKEMLSKEYKFLNCIRKLK